MLPGHPAPTILRELSVASNTISVQEHLVGLSLVQ